MVRVMGGSVHPHADGEEDVGETLLVGRLDGQDVVGGGDGLVKIPLGDRLENGSVQPRLVRSHPTVIGPDGRVLESGRRGLRFRSPSC